MTFLHLEVVWALSEITRLFHHCLQEKGYTLKNSKSYHYYILLILCVFSDDDSGLLKEIFTTRDPDNTRYLLEEEYGFDICVHSRNFIAGEPETGLISRAVNLSRRTIVLLTRYVLVHSLLQN